MDCIHHQHRPTFQDLCQTIQSIREKRSTNDKIRICADYFTSLKSDENLNLAAQFIAEGAFSSISGERASVGSRTTGLAASAFCEIDYNEVYKPCRTATGSNSEAIARLMDHIPAALKKREPVRLTLQDVESHFKKLRSASSRSDKEALLQNMWKKMLPVEIKYSIRMLGQGSLRIGFETRSVAASIANAFGCDRESVHYAHMITGSIGETAVLARRGRLGDARFRLFHPLSFMLASPIESRSVSDLGEYVAEEKFDGMRAQVHVSGEKIEIFSRDLNNVTTAFPDIVSFFSEREIPELVLDGEICVFKNERILPFQLLQKRMGRKMPGKKVLEENPVIFISYDLLYIDGETIFNESLSVRRKKLVEICVSYKVPVSKQFSVESVDELEEWFERALLNGNEGLMLKKRDSAYEYGQRRSSWLKLKKPGGSIDTVMMYAHAGSGKRGGLYSDFTLGVSVKNDERYEEEFVPIGKAYGGYTDEELKRMNKKIKELTVQRYGPTLGLLPELIVEIEFDDIQVNSRTKAGYTLRLPRFKAIRWDLGPDDVNSLRDVEKLFEVKMNQKRSPQKGNSSFLFHKGKL
jgi:DNA ligase 1